MRGQRLSDLRFAVEAARIRVYDLFNDLNSDDAFDVHCQIEDSTGTRMREQTCRPKFKDDVSETAAKAWMQAIRDACNGQLKQDCIFDPGMASQGKAAAMGVESFGPIMQNRFEVEMARVIAKSPEMQQALLDYEAVERAYDEARDERRPRDCDRPTPPARCAR